MAAPDPAPQLSKDSSCTGGGVHTGAAAAEAGHMAAPDPAPQLSKDSSCTGGGVHTCPSGGPPGSSPTWRGGFFKSLQRLWVLGIVARAGRELAVAERTQFPAQCR